MAAETFTVTLDLTGDELETLKRVLHDADARMVNYANSPAISAGGRLNVTYHRRTVGIVLQQLRRAVRTVHDAGPVGSCRYTVR